MNNDKKYIIISAIIDLVCLLGEFVYIIYSTANNSQDYESVPYSQKKGSNTNVYSYNR